MEALLESIALSYAKSKGLSYITDEAREYAAKKLGVDTKNPKYAISLGNMKIDPMKIVGNQLFKSAISGGKMSMGIPLMAGALGLAYMRNPLREGSMNYNPELQGQIDYLSGMDNMIGKNQSSGLLQYGPDSVLRGKNVVSMFGNNDYAKSLQNYIDKMEARKAEGYNTIGFGPFKTKTTNFTDFQQSQLDKAKTELSNIRDNEIQQELNREVQSRNQITRNLMTQNNAYTGGGGGGGGGFDTSAADRAGTSAGSGQFSPSTSRGRSGYSKGGIASL